MQALEKSSRSWEMLAPDFLGCMFIRIIASRVASPAIAYPRKPLQSGSEPLQERADRLEEQSFLPNWRADVRDFHAGLFLSPIVFNICLFFSARESSGDPVGIRRKKPGSLRIAARIYDLSSSGLPPRRDRGRSNFARDPDEEAWELSISGDGLISHLADLYLSLPGYKLRPDFSGVKHGKRNCEIWKYFSSICDSVLFSTIFSSSALRIFMHFNLIFLQFITLTKYFNTE